MTKNPVMFDRELSWLAFNHRVLQEAIDEGNPLLERLRFLAIFSSNLEEFFKVRVASLRSLHRLDKSDRKQLDLKVKKLLKQIMKEVLAQQEAFGACYRNALLPAMESQGIVMVNDSTAGAPVVKRARKFFDGQLKTELEPTDIDPKNLPFLKARKIYLVFELEVKKTGLHRYSLVEIPSEKLGRFHVFKKADKHHVFFLEDIVRLFQSELFADRQVVCAHSITISRDAELYLEDEFEGNVLEKIRKSLGKRQTGAPTRLLYDASMPKDMLKALMQLLELQKDETVAGDRYHHFNNLFKFPNPEGRLAEFDRPVPVPHPALDHCSDFFSLIDNGDRMLHLPYQTFDPVIAFLQQAATDPKVSAIYMTLYRVSSESKVVEALLQALEHGKHVFVFTEIKARFDEHENIQVAEQLQRAGGTVVYDIPDLKVHCKVCLVERATDDAVRGYCYMASGNFNEGTARFYTDIGLFTSDPAIVNDAKKLFGMLQDGTVRPDFEKLLVAPHLLRSSIYSLIDGEIGNAKAGKDAHITMKMNSLEDEGVIRKLYEASQAGVQIDLIVRGICRLVPGIKGLSERIAVMSIVGRYLEHSRVYIFHQAGANKVYAGSADMMKRNLSHRVEVIFPVEDPILKDQLLRMMQLHLSDNVKARIVDSKQRNRYRETKDAPIDSQAAMPQLLRSLPVAEKEDTNAEIAQ